MKLYQWKECQWKFQSCGFVNLSLSNLHTYVCYMARIKMPIWDCFVSFYASLEWKVDAHKYDTKLRNVNVDGVVDYMAFIQMKSTVNRSSPYKLQLATDCTSYRWYFYFTLCVLNFSEGTKTYIYIFCHSSTLAWDRQLKSFLVYHKNLPIPHSQYHRCWCPGDARSQGISNHDIYFFEPN